MSDTTSLLSFPKLYAAEFPLLFEENYKSTFHLIEIFSSHSWQCPPSNFEQFVNSSQHPPIIISK